MPLTRQPVVPCPVRPASARPAPRRRPSPLLVLACLAALAGQAGAQALPNHPLDCGAAPAVDAALGLPEVVRAVVCRHGGVRQGEGLADQARAALGRANGQMQPSLGATLGYSGAAGSRPSTAVTLRLDWVLYDFGARHGATRQATEALQAVLNDQQAEVLNAVAQAAQAYWAARSARARLDAAGTNLRVAQDSARAAQARQGAGAATLTEKLQAQRALAQARLDQTRAHSAWASAAGTLRLAMGLAAAPHINLPPDSGDDERQAEAAPDVAALINEATAAHPRVLAAQRRLAEADARTQTAESERWGSVRLNARAGRVGGDSSVSGNRSAGVEWSVPLFDREVLRSRIDDARGQARVRSASLEETQRLVSQQVWEEGQGLIGEREALGVARELLDSAETALRVATERFRLGASSLTDVLAAQEAAASARFQWAEARANVLRARWRLAAAVGRLGPLAAR